MWIRLPVISGLSKDQSWRIRDDRFYSALQLRTVSKWSTFINIKNVNKYTLRMTSQLCSRAFAGHCRSCWSKNDSKNRSGAMCIIPYITQVYANPLTLIHTSVSPYSPPWTTRVVQEYMKQIVNE